jgi:hypothetical protein
MSHENLSRETTFGYLSTLETKDFGYFGGYLILSQFGRPMEFHCTSPVRPSRAQEILYGPTLQPYLLGEQISGALLAAAKLTPRMILTDQPAMSFAKSPSNVPVTLVVLSRGARGEPVASQFASEAAAASSCGKLTTSRSSGDVFTLGDYDVRLSPGFEGERRGVVELLNLLCQHVDLAEPFGRIHEAIREAQRIGARSGDAHVQAA